jgi:hypothetical protein
MRLLPCRSAYIERHQASHFCVGFFSFERIAYCLLQRINFPGESRQLFSGQDATIASC